MPTLKKSKMLSNWPKWLVVTQSVLFGSQDLEIRSYVSSFSESEKNGVASATPATHLTSFLVQDLLACSRRMKIPFSSLIWQQHTRLWVNGLTCNSKEKRSLKHKWLDMNLESPLLILLLWKQIAFFTITLFAVCVLSMYMHFVHTMCIKDISI